MKIEHDFEVNGRLIRFPNAPVGAEGIGFILENNETLLFPLGSPDFLLVTHNKPYELIINDGEIVLPQQRRTSDGQDTEYLYDSDGRQIRSLKFKGPVATAIFDSKTHPVLALEDRTTAALRKHMRDHKMLQFFSVGMTIAIVLHFLSTIVQR